MEPNHTATQTQEAVKVEPHNWTDGGDRVLILRRINADGTSYGGFNGWGEQSTINNVVACHDWSPRNKCGGGLHGWPWGMGLGDGHDYSIIDDRWLVIAARPEDVVGELEGGHKCKAREVVKLYDGPFAGAWAMINGGRHRLIEAMATQGTPDVASGDSSKAASSGNYSTAASSGDSSKAAASGNYSKAASSGDSSKAASSGNSSTAASSGNYSTAASSGNYSTAASSGNYSTAASSGNYSTAASSGNYSTAASSGDSSKAASSGNYSTAAQSGKSGIAASIGHGGIVMAGELGCIIACYWSDSESRYRAVVGYVGENGIKPGVRYRLNGEHKLEAV
jgi:hypothetical protein